MQGNERIWSGKNIENDMAGLEGDDTNRTLLPGCSEKSPNERE